MKRNGLISMLMLAVIASVFVAAANTPPNLALAQSEPKEKSGDDQITICHLPPGNPENRQTITISRSALEAHLTHGDFVGTCEENSEVGPKRPY